MIREYSAFTGEPIKEGIGEQQGDEWMEAILVLEVIFGAVNSIVLRWVFSAIPMVLMRPRTLCLR